MRAGDVVWNPLSGEKAMVVESARDTGGARIVTDFAVEAGGFVPGGEHVHDHCEEHFEVRAGRMAFLLGGEERVLDAGEQLTVPRGTWHRWWNPGDDEAVARVRVEPALRFEEAILAYWGLCADGHTNAEGRPSPLFGALLATRYRDEIRYRQPPDLVQRTMFPTLAAVARRRGLGAVLDRYLDLDTHPTAQAGLGRLPERVIGGAAEHKITRELPADAAGWRIWMVSNGACDDVRLREKAQALGHAAFLSERPEDDELRLDAFFDATTADVGAAAEEAFDRFADAGPQGGTWYVGFETFEPFYAVDRAWHVDVGLWPGPGTGDRLAFLPPGLDGRMETRHGASRHIVSADVQSTSARLAEHLVHDRIRAAAANAGRQIEIHHTTTVWREERGR
ncbi:MAG: cupin domain-containing protein [Solirubrobacterales bacterium]|nr:cupin domain-containing protein [Solirubrobacterales bacterium]